MNSCLKVAKISILFLALTGCDQLGDGPSYGRYASVDWDSLYYSQTERPSENSCGSLSGAPSSSC